METKIKRNNNKLYNKTDKNIHKQAGHLSDSWWTPCNELED